MSAIETEVFEAKVREQLEERAAMVGGKPWGVAQGKPRIYLPSRRDTQVFIEFPGYPTGDEADLLGGPKLSVIIDDYGQHTNWYKRRRAKVISDHAEIMDRLAHIASPPQEEPLHGEPVTRKRAEGLVVGERVTFFYGGAPGEDNAERSYAGAVKKVFAETDQAGTISPAPDGQTVFVLLDDGSGSRDAAGAEGCAFYTWRGLLRYGGGAEVVRM